jgi:hypothetical protein
VALLSGEPDKPKFKVKQEVFVQQHLSDGRVHEPASVAALKRACIIHDAAVMEVTGHKTLAMVHSYNRRTKRWANPASARLGL